MTATPSNSTDGPTGRRRAGWQIGLMALALGALLALQPSIFRDAVSSPRTLLIVVGIIAAFVGLAAVGRRFVANPGVRLALLAIPGLALGWYVVGTSMRDVMVVEDFPAVAVAVPEAPGAAAAVPEALVGSTAAPAVPSAPAAAGTPQLLVGGDFAGIGHRASGGAALFALDDATTVVRLEDIDIQNGPDLVVYLVPGEGAQHPGDQGVSLGALKGNQGSQNYEVPAGFPTDGPLTVLVYCRAFSVPFAHATLV